MPIPTCAEAHPEDPARHCMAEAEAPHLAHVDAVGTWPNEPVALLRSRLPASNADARKRALDIANNSERAVVRPPVVRGSDPTQSHEAAEAIEPHRGTRKGQALAVLRAHLDEWVTAAAFQTDTTGGEMSGTRRVRELRADGHSIDIRRRPDTSNTWEYRLREEQDSDGQASRG